MPSVTIENTSARILMINLGGGQVCTVPPTEGGITVTFDDAEQALFDKAIATPAVAAWIESGELVITPAESETEPETEPEIEPADDEEDP